MPESLRQDLNDWIARIAQTGESFAQFSTEDLVSGSFREFHGESGFAEFFGLPRSGNSSSGAAFHAYTLEAFVGSVHLFGTLRTGSGVERGGEDFTRDAREKLIAIGLLRGSLKYRNGKHAGVLGPGDVLVVNSTHPLVTASTGVVETLGMAVPIDDIARDSRVTSGHWPVRLPESALTSAFLAFIGRYLVEDATAEGVGQVSSGLAEPVLYDLLRSVLLQVVPATMTPAQQSLRLQADVHDLIEKYHVLQGFDADSIARALHISRRKLYRDLAEQGEGVAGLIAARRVRSAAAILLEQPAMSLSEVSAAAGFGDATTMRRHFLSKLGVTPADYRRENT